MSIDYRPIEIVSQPRKTGLSLRDWLILTGVLGGLIGCAAYIAMRYKSMVTAEKARFQPAMAELLLAPVAGAPDGARPRIGKVVLVNIAKREIDELHFMLPESIRAQSPEEATALGQLQYTRQVIGRYGKSDARAVQLSCILTVIDRKTRTVIASRPFQWGNPTTSISSVGAHGDVIGSAPRSQ